MLPAFLVLSGLSVSAMSSELKVSFEGLRNLDGIFLYLVFKDADGVSGDQFQSVLQGELSASETRSGPSLKLEEGTRAMTLIHDENSNDKLDKGLMGMSKEGFGFSSNPRFFFGSPSFERASFKVKGNSEIELKVKYL